MTFGSIVGKLALLAYGLFVMAGTAQAGGELFDGCADARGKSVPTIVDDALPLVALAAMEGNRAVVRYNPSRLPELSSTARMFFFAHECARVSLGLAGTNDRSPERAQQADCRALDTLRRSGVVPDADAQSRLLRDLRIMETDWIALAGPRRNISFDNCGFRGGLRMPDSAPPSDAQARVDRCVQICGDRLWQCQGRCRDGSCRGGCLSGYERCEAGCGR